MTRKLFCLLLGLSGLAVVASTGWSQQPSPRDASRPRRCLLLGQGPDGHPFLTHEYMAGLAILERCLKDVDGLELETIRADEPWADGPKRLDQADGAVVFLSQGAHWLSQSPERLAAFRRLAKRGGGLVVIHWGMGTRNAEDIEAFVELFGGCHGGPDRRYKVVQTRLEPVSANHPVLRGVEPVDVHDEFYYRLKFHRTAKNLTPLLQVHIEGEPHTVAWAWERPDGGHSFGFSGCHFHANWGLPAYRRVVAQAVLWTLHLPVPQDGLPVPLRAEDLRVAPRDSTRSKKTR